MIGILDSGIGGEGIEKEIHKLLPKVKTMYLRDSKNFPYGNKNIQELKKIIFANCQTLIKKGVQMIVMACNTGSVCALEYLRAKLPVPIVGVVPAVKPAAKLTKTKAIAVFATPVTCESKILDDLIKKYAQGITVYKIPFSDLASLIETHQIATYTSKVSEVWQKYQGKNIDVIVLGCTHYPLISKDIQKIVGPKIKLVDAEMAVAKQTKKLYDSIIHPTSLL